MTFHGRCKTISVEVTPLLKIRTCWKSRFFKLCCHKCMQYMLNYISYQCFHGCKIIVTAL
jgi:hypothetical protein